MLGICQTLLASGWSIYLGPDKQVAADDSDLSGKLTHGRVGEDPGLSSYVQINTRQETSLRETVGCCGRKRPE